MKLYHIKEEYQPTWGWHVDDYSIVTEEEVKTLSEEWEKPVEELLEQLEEDDEIIPFVASVFLAEGDKQEMSKADAADIMKAWDEEEVEYPMFSLTPEILSSVWNDMLKGV